MTAIHAHDVRPGDIVAYRGRPHRVGRVDRREGWAWPILIDDTGWAMALGDDVSFVRRGA